ncbi:hypothetical protein ACFE04_020772 [Oxalis oulophora]
MPCLSDETGGGSGCWVAASSSSSSSSMKVVSKRSSMNNERSEEETDEDKVVMKYPFEKVFHVYVYTRVHGMARQSDLLKNVDFTKSNWNVHFRVMRIWEPLYDKQKFTSSLELVVSDRNDNVVHCATVDDEISEKKIQENGIYFIKDFFVTRNVVKANQTKVSTHKYKISFQQNTSIDDATNDDFPPISFI